MNIDRTEHSRLTTWISWAAPWTATGLIAWAIGELWRLRAEDSSLVFSPLAAALAVTVCIGILGQSRDRAHRLKTALDTYAEREIVRAAAFSGPRHPTRNVASISAFDEH